MPKYESKIIYSVEENEIYKITDCEEAYTEKTGAEMLKVTLLNKKVDDMKRYGMTLWPRGSDDISANSGLGCMIAALGNDTATWIGKYIFIRKWTPKFSEVSLMNVKESKKEVK
jgi:hypothetical protein